MKKTLFISLLFTHSLLEADSFGTIFMSATLFTLLLTLIIALMIHLKKLRKEALKSQALFDYTDTPTLFINSKGTLLDINQAAQTLTGYPKKQLLNQKWYEKLLPEGSALQIGRLIHQTPKNDGRTTFISSLIRADGNLLEVRCTLSNLPAPLRGAVLTLEEITAGGAEDSERNCVVDADTPSCSEYSI